MVVQEVVLPIIIILLAMLYYRSGLILKPFTAYNNIINSTYSKLEKIPHNIK